MSTAAGQTPSETRPTAKSRRLGDFILLEEIGRGGMGKVYRARQVSLEREVALKVLPSTAGMDPEAVARFRREAEAAGRLSHPGIVPIYGVGDIDGTYYYTMELIEGPSLWTLLEKLRGAAPDSFRNTLMEETAMSAVYPSLPEIPIPSFLANALYPASCAALIMEVAGALIVAHQGKVIHRDIKPSNILLHPAGRPVLVDFGLARDEMAFSMTQTGEAVGTPCYMAPEQAEGCRHVDARVDVYGLGATLYELLTLQPPFDGAHPGEIMQGILEEDPVPPRKINPRVPRALDTIVLTCLAKDPDRRYPSSSDLQSDLRAFLAGGRIRARRPGLVEILGRRIRRNRRSAYVAVISVMFALFVGMMVGLVSLNNTRQQGRLALDEAKSLLLEGKPRESHDAYVQALVLLKDREFVAERRLLDFRGIFAVMYEKKRYKVLAEFLDNLPNEDVDRPEYHEFRRRLRGIGHLAVRRDPGQGVRVWIRGIVGDEFEAKWRRRPLDGWLSIGQYLVRLESAGNAPLVRAIEIERDARLDLTPRFRKTANVPTGMCLVTPTDAGEFFAVDRTEFEAGKYLEFLHSVTNRKLAAELRPSGFNENGNPSVPVTGLSHRQARMAAALLGGHLLTRREYVFAATGGLRELTYPWGRHFDVSRVAGDPRYTSSLAPARSKEAGASPAGVLHLVGNAAEPLAAEGDGRLFLAGGHYSAEPRDLTVLSLVARRDPREVLPFAGLRLARFLPPADDRAADERVEARLADVVAAANPALSPDESQRVAGIWTVQSDGVVRVRQILALPPDAAPRALRFFADFARLRGFLDLDPPVTKDLAGNPLVVDLKRVANVVISTRRPTEGELFGIETRRRMAPVTGLYGFGDSYYLRIPVTGGRSVHRVELPVGSHVDEVWPTPQELYYLGGAPILVWYGEAVPRWRREAVVRFRRDGTMSRRLPVLAEVEPTVTAFFAALSAADTRALSRLLAADCRLEPQGWDKAELLRKVRILGSYGDLVVDDCVAVGDMWTVEVRVSLHSSVPTRRRAVAKGWPLRLILRPTADGVRVVRMMPSSRPDLGRCESGAGARTGAKGAEGAKYLHARLKVEVQPASGVSIVRRADGVAPLQVSFRPSEDRSDGAAGEAAGSCFARLVGCFADEADDARGIRMRLTSGTESWRRGERVSGNQETLIGKAGSGNRIVGASEHWVFRTHDGKGWMREQWTFVNLGHRHLLLRCVAVGATRAEAQRRFRLRQDWFEALRQALRVY